MQQNKSSNVGIVIAVIVVLVGIGAAAFALNSNTTKDSDSDQTTPTKSSDTAGKTDTANSEQKAVVGSTVITFTDKGFDKSSYTSKTGEAVTVKNASSMDLQFSSDDHPSHRDHPELNMAVMGPGESGTFVPPAAGTYGFHDHIDDSFTGTLTVE